MGELGDAVAEMHAEIGAFARRSGVDRLFALGEASSSAVQAFGERASHFDTVEALVSAVKPQIGPQTTVLIKGSRFMKMERIVEALVGEISSVQRNH